MERLDPTRKRYISSLKKEQELLTANTKVPSLINKVWIIFCFLCWLHNIGRELSSSVRTYTTVTAWSNKCFGSRKMSSPITPSRKTSQCWTSILGFRLCRVIWNFNLVIERYMCNVISLRISEVTADDTGRLHFQPWRVLWALSWIQHNLIYRDCLLVHHCALSKHFKKIKENSKSLKKSCI